MRSNMGKTNHRRLRSLYRETSWSVGGYREGLWDKEEEAECGVEESRVGGVLVWFDEGEGEEG